MNIGKNTVFSGEQIMQAFKCDWCGSYQEYTGNIIRNTAKGYINEEEVCDVCEKKFEAMRKKIIEGKR